MIQTNLNNFIEQKHLCRCGCGKETNIITYNTSTKKKGEYNLYITGHHNIGKPRTQEAKDKISVANTGKKRSDEFKIRIKKINQENALQRVGTHLPDNTKLKISIGNKGKQRTDEVKQKMSDKAKLKVGELNNFYGKHHTEEAKEKNRLAHLGKATSIGYKHSDEAKEKNRLAHLGKETWMKGKQHTEEIKQVMKEKRKNQKHCYTSSIEVKIQNYLKELGYEYFTHQYMKIEHAYQCDIFIPSMNLVIECDGMYWHKYPTGRDIDKIRTEELLQKGFKVLRLWELDIRDMTLEQLRDTILKVK